MPLDDHRAPNRLATQHLRAAHYSGGSPVRRIPDFADQPVPDYEVVEEPYWPNPGQPEENGLIIAEQPEPAGDRESQVDYQQGGETESGETVPPVFHEPPHAAPETPPMLGELTKQELHQLLMHTIQLYDDVWKLSGVRAYPDKRMLAAYLTPRHKRMGLKEAIHKQRVLVITIDGWGNTDIKEPRKRGWLRWLTSWITGDY